MGIAVTINAYFDNVRTYLVKTASAEVAKVLAYHKAKEDFPVSMPDTLQEAEATDGIFISVLGYVDEII